MAAAVNFPCRIPRQAISLKGVARLAFGSTPSKGSCQLMPSNVKMEREAACLRKQVNNKSLNKRWVSMVVSAAGDFDFKLGSSPSNMIKQFYACINDKKLKELDGYVSEDCHFEDCSFLQPMQGKKEVMHFFRQLTAGMGQNVKFVIEHVCVDDEMTAGVNWHLEWKTIQIPFTRGCSFYECSHKDDRLIIKKALVVIESPIKPGGIVLTLLKNVTAIFDDFPKAAEWLLKSPHVIMQVCSKIYSRLLAPFVNPLLAGYIRAWNLAARLFAFALNIVLHFLTKYFG
ncbi:NUCLEAR TRANSPORT FACTOR 2 (NTF2) FAMILY PROTEIN [Salix koriyanagi]|uniref:NUCLEAR TRANSPORT FACTOR 2 (NTF2) FAMILY PROTEIN n=1 Tax=Salix koriyanagi TaxID=2511006 RepID=A0A9Q0SZQ4_9ROSI|nr:NUCLEAR TRANSPORT FACTOR 2 (NTF2) FAMILY PROTEIN [Salix koriyanagi]